MILILFIVIFSIYLFIYLFVQYLTIIKFKLFLQINKNINSNYIVIMKINECFYKEKIKNYFSLSFLLDIKHIFMRIISYTILIHHLIFKFARITSNFLFIYK
jgi:hypothetical protein